MDDRILVISFIGCGGPPAGNRTRMRALLHEIRRLGFSIHFAGVNMSDEEREATLPYIDKWVTNFRHLKPSLPARFVRKLTRILTGAKPVAVDDKMSIDRWFDVQWNELAKRIQLSANYERIMVAYVFHSAFLNCFPGNCLKLIDTHDVFAERTERLASGGAAQDWFTTTRVEEKIGLMRADRILAIQSHEAQYFRQLTDQERPVYTVGHLTEPKFLTHPVAEPPIIGILASDNTLNVSGMNWFFKEVWPLVLASNPGATLRIGGTICAFIATSKMKAELIGEIDDPADFYAQCSFTVNPMQAGTGLKIKTVESLSFGRPAVVSPPCAEGLESCIGRGLLVAENASHFANLIDQLLHAPKEIERLGRAAVEAIACFNEDARNNLKKALDNKLTA